MAVLDILKIGKPERKQVAAVIDVDEFEADAKDADWQSELELARRHVEKLEDDGRSV